MLLNETKILTIVSEVKMQPELELTSVNEMQFKRPLIRSQNSFKIFDSQIRYLENHTYDFV